LWVWLKVNRLWVWQNLISDWVDRKPAPLFVQAQIVKSWHQWSIDK
jgi:hypothetical protein